MPTYEQTFFFNSGFDLEIGNIPTKPYTKIINELMFCPYPIGTQHDATYSIYKPPQEYFDYLDDLHIGHTRSVNIQEDYSSCIPAAWGWDRSTRELFTRLKIQYTCPDLGTITSVNSRIFSNDLCVELGSAHSVLCRDSTELYATVAKAETLPIVIKQRFGSSGSGFMIKQNREWSKREKNRITSLYRVSGQQLLVEPWRRRIADYSAYFELKQDGTIPGISFNRLEVNKQGIFSAITVDSITEKTFKYFKEFAKATELIVSKVHQAGYFGPLGIDAYSYYDTAGREAFNPLSEINARRTMADISLLLKKKLGANTCKLFSLTRKKLDMLTGYRHYMDSFRPLHYNAQTGEGVVLLLPLYYYLDDETVIPERQLVLVCANDSDRLDRLADTFFITLKTCKL